MEFSAFWYFLISLCIVLPTQNVCFSFHNAERSHKSVGYRSQNRMRQGGPSHRTFSHVASPTIKQAPKKRLPELPQYGLKKPYPHKAQSAKRSQPALNKARNHANGSQKFSHTHGQQFIKRLQHIFVTRSYHEIVNYVVFPCIWKRSPTEMIIMNTQADFFMYQPLIFTPSVYRMLVAASPSTVVVTNTGYTFAGSFVKFNNYGITAFGCIR